MLNGKKLLKSFFSILVVFAFTCNLFVVGAYTCFEEPSEVLKGKIAKNYQVDMKPGYPLTYTEPYLLKPTINSIYVCWLTSERTSCSYVEFGLTESYGSIQKATSYEIEGIKTVDENGQYTVPLKVYQQIVHIKGLKPGTRYFYRAVSENGKDKRVGPGYYLKTAPKPGTPFKAVLLSDLQLKAQAPATLKLVGQQEPDIIIYNGDLQNAPYNGQEWFSIPGTTEPDQLRWFNMLQQTEDRCKLLQYTPIYPCPGNHEVDIQELMKDKTLADRKKMSLSIYMQLFRPLYPEQEYFYNGKHWYSSDYGDLHIVSLSIFRWFAWNATEAPGWFLFDDMKKGSPQYNWLENDLKTSKNAKYTWITQHWHMFNRGNENQFAFTDPVPSKDDPNVMEYPADKDYLQQDIKPLFEKYGVDAVSYGHSHVYERYLINGVNYIEAASIGNNYRLPNDPYDPNGDKPAFEENSFRSFMVVSVDPQGAMTAKGIQASVETDGTGYIGRVFDEFTVAKPNRSLKEIEQDKSRDKIKKYFDQFNVKVQILGMNDFHGQLNVTKKVNNAPVGRADYLASYLKQRTGENENTLLVHTGDMVGASAPVSALLQDEPTVDIMNELGFDVGTCGNHEFDEGVDEMLRLVNGGYHPATGKFKGANFAYTCANVVDKDTGKYILPPYVIKMVKGIPVGFIGVALSDTPGIVEPKGVAKVKFIDETEAVNKVVPMLKHQGVKAIVILAHVPGTQDSNTGVISGEIANLANAVDDEVDVIFAGHNHGYLNGEVDGKLIVESYANGTAFSDVDLEINLLTRDVVSKKAEIVTTFQDGTVPDAKITEMIAAYAVKVAPMIERVVGTAANDITSTQNGSGESALGNLIADAQRVNMSTDFAFMNPGGIRDDIASKEVTWGELFTVQPFNNTLVKMALSGDQIRTLLNQQWQEKATRMLQISGLKYTWDSTKPMGMKVVDIFLPDGNTVDPAAKYTVTVNSFLAEGGDGFAVLTQGTDRINGPSDLDALVLYLKSLPQPFTASIEGRITKIN